MTKFEPFNHRRIAGLALSFLLVLAAFSGAWAKKDAVVPLRFPNRSATVVEVPGARVVVPTPFVPVRPVVMPAPGGTVQKHKGHKKHDVVVPLPPVPVPPVVVPVPGVNVQKHKLHEKEHVVPQAFGDNRRPPKEKWRRKHREYYTDHHWKHWGNVYGHSPWEYRRRPRYGSVHRHLPPNFFRIFIGGVPFFYSAGIYFQAGPRGYVVVQPPIGARIKILPEGCSFFYFGGRRCYSCDDIFYEEVDNEYIVMARPTRFRLIAEVGDEVQVDADTLNVRSGPGLRYDRVSILRRGEIAEVGAVDGDWYYVTLEDGSYGWVMRQYTRIISFEENPKG